MERVDINNSKDREMLISRSFGAENIIKNLELNDSKIKDSKEIIENFTEQYNYIIESFEKSDDKFEFELEIYSIIGLLKTNWLNIHGFTEDEKREGLKKLKVEDINKMEKVKEFSQFFKHISLNLLNKLTDILEEVKEYNNLEKIKYLKDYKFSDLFYFLTIKLMKDVDRGNVNMSEIDLPEEKLEFDKDNALNTETVPATQITKKDKLVLLEIMSSNWAFNKDIKVNNIKLLKEFFKDQGANIVIMKYKKEIVGFFGYSKKTNDIQSKKDVYNIKFLNITTDLRGYGIAWKLLKTELEKIAKDKILDCTVLPSLRVSSMYIDDFGFVVDGIQRKSMGSNEDFFHITRDDDKKYTLTGATAEELKMYMKNKSLKAQKDIGDGVVIKNFSKSNYKKMIDEVERFTSKGYVVTVYKKDFSQDGDVFIAFEKQKN